LRAKLVILVKSLRDSDTLNEGQKADGSKGVNTVKTALSNFVRSPSNAKRKGFLIALPRLIKRP
jgi:hypothetical protein